jgi:hypothetical protein
LTNCYDFLWGEEGLLIFGGLLMERMFSDSAANQKKKKKQAAEAKSCSKRQAGVCGLFDKSRVQER